MDSVAIGVGLWVAALLVYTCDRSVLGGGTDQSALHRELVGSHVYTLDRTCLTQSGAKCAFFAG